MTRQRVAGRRPPRRHRMARYNEECYPPGRNRIDERMRVRWYVNL